ncbi:hypothetical protein GCM10011507_10890 [Edaphobacter acidisoli]|uniref:TadE-like domain-containing protein n=1 Tax=Edaphobacter acidisoli TaxID=2040573 RepID=A0A916RMZ1_9BACT|nr:TadE/TadG family type IV pilus assembly protein [Edaphobacter acidisoli]GGA61218.1 hypothetical protein GCM10011507_10890 [Edaphobacter acidisoli]
MAIVTTVRKMAAKALAHRHNGEQGNTLVEMAVSALLLLCFIFGVMEICLALYTYHNISEAAREATRFAIVRGNSCTSWASACPASTGDIQNYVKGLGYPGIDPSKMTITPTWTSYTSGYTCPAAPSPCNSTGNLVTVKVQYNFPLSLPFVSLTTIPMSSTSAMIISD